MDKCQAAIIGGGPAGLMAAEQLALHGVKVCVFDAKPTMGRKFLMAGKSGLNITHSEPMPTFVTRYGPAQAHLHAALEAFSNQNLRDWAEELGTATFIGSSGRVFPEAMKASPLLRAWMTRLLGQGVRFFPRHKWQGWDDSNRLIFDTPAGQTCVPAQAVVLALGGASWPDLGSDAAWVPVLKGGGIKIAPFRPANCGFDVEWSGYFAERFAGEPVKGVTASIADVVQQGEFVVTGTGVEGSLVYALSAPLRDACEGRQGAVLTLDLTPDRSEQVLIRELLRQPRKLSFSNRLRRATGLVGVKAALLREAFAKVGDLPPEQLARAIKACPIHIVRPRPIEEAISSAGGISWAEITPDFMLEKKPGVFVAGEMIDWEAPTGGYLLTACFATGRAAGEGAVDWLKA